MKISITKLPHPEHHGDWHDKPLKWLAAGPGNETQKFAIKKEAMRYAAIRRRSINQTEAINQYARS